MSDLFDWLADTCSSVHARERIRNSKFETAVRTARYRIRTAGYRQIKIQNRGLEPHTAILEPRTAVLPRYSAVLRTAVLRVTLYRIVRV